MIVSAVRDDGALLITSSGLAAMIYSEGRTWLTSTDSALARGEWQPTDTPLPDDLPDDAAAQLAPADVELAESAAFIEGPPRPPSPVTTAAAEQGAEQQAELGHRTETAAETAAGVDFAAIAEAHSAAVAGLVATWPGLTAAIIAALVAAAATAATGGALADLAGLAVDEGLVADLAAALGTAMDALSGIAAGHAAGEVKHQGGKAIKPKRAGADRNSEVAQVLARLIVDGYTSAATRVALQHAGADEAALRAAVEDSLNQMSGSGSGWVADNVTAAMSAAQAAGRRAVFEMLPDSTTYLASEKLDRSTCKPCRDIDGTEFPDLAEADLNYPTGLYRDCLGRSRCRGMTIPILTT